MTSEIFSSKWIIFKSAIKRFKWLSILYGVILFLATPLLIWMQLARQKEMQGTLWVETANKFYPHQDLFNSVAHLINLAAAIVFGLLIFHYLHKDRESTFIHSLPIKRASLYWQKLAGGLTLIWLPILINGAIIYGVYAMFGVTAGQWQYPYMQTTAMDVVKNTSAIVPIWQVVGFWLLLNLLMTGLFFIFTVFAGMLTGSVLMQGALTIIGLFLPLGLYILADYSLWRLLYGYPRENFGYNVEWLSPIVSYLSDNSYRALFTATNWYLGYFFVTVILCFLSIYLYKIRPSEAAGETLAGNWMRWIFKYGVATCAGLTGGIYFSAVSENSLGFLYIGYFTGALLGYVIADMIAYKSFHFYKRWKGMIVFGAVFVALLTSINLDFYGYERRIPEQDQIKEVLMSNINRDGMALGEGLKTQDNIMRVRELHRQIIKLEETNKQQEQLNQRANSEILQNNNVMMIPLDLTYKLKNGSQMKRRYLINVLRYRDFLYPIYSSQEAKKIMHAQLFKLDISKVDQIIINNHRLGKTERLYNKEDIVEAVKALKKDVLNIPYEAAIEGSIPSQAQIEFISYSESENQRVSYNLSYYRGYKNFEDFMSEREQFKDLFINPQEVSSVNVKKVGSPDSVVVKDNNSIQNLIGWINLEDEETYAMRQTQTENKYYTEYYGKVIMKDGTVLYVSFDNSPFPRNFINKILKEK